MSKYNVYEERQGGILHFIGMVHAESQDEAIDRAHEQYGGRITVKEQLIP